MPEPRIKRYALVSSGRQNGVRRFHLARVAGATGGLPAAERLERMDQIALNTSDRERTPRTRSDRSG
jgi:hypothetical protein